MDSSRFACGDGMDTCAKCGLSSGIYGDYADGVEIET
jgi:hypothetical protein